MELTRACTHGRVVQLECVGRTHGEDSLTSRRLSVWTAGVPRSAVPRNAPVKWRAGNLPTSLHPRKGANGGPQPLSLVTLASLVAGDGGQRHESGGGAFSRAVTWAALILGAAALHVLAGPATCRRPTFASSPSVSHAASVGQATSAAPCFARISSVAEPLRKKRNSFMKAAVDKVAPSVVRLDAERPLQLPRPGDGADLFQQFFGDDALSPTPFPRNPTGQGSGFVVDGSLGLILTNAHVVRDSPRVKVTFRDGRVYSGSVKARDDVTDLAVVELLNKPPGTTLPVAPLGESSSLDVGDWVMAIGNPFGLQSTVTLGIVSALHRSSAEVGVPDMRLDFLQTDCAMNPGNSGGPLVNEFGEVVGINTAIRADADGISFAIPINLAKRALKVMREGRPVRHAYIGVQMENLTPETARRYNDITDALAGGGGAGAGALWGGPASYDNNNASDAGTSRGLGSGLWGGGGKGGPWGGEGKGGSWDIQVMSGGKHGGSSPSSYSSSSSSSLPSSGSGNSRPNSSNGHNSSHGYGSSNGSNKSSARENAYQLIPEDIATPGVVVVRVPRGSPAALATVPLKYGDVIIEVGGKRVFNVGQVQAAVDAAGVGEVVKVKVRRRGVGEVVSAIRTGDLADCKSSNAKAWATPW